MLENRFLGIPLLFWGAGCLLVALAFVFVAPKEHLADASALRGFVLRWFHSLVWVLLAASCFIRAAGGASGLANQVAFGGLIAYLIFMASLFMRY